MNAFTWSRRRFLNASVLVSLGAMTGTAVRVALAQDPYAKMMDTRTISPQSEYYCGWPTVTRRSNGELILVWSGGREGHVCPFGRVDMMRSQDNGETWSCPRTCLDSSIDDRDAGIVETVQGTLLVTTFTSLAYWSLVLEKALEKKPGEEGAWSQDKLDRWLAVHNRLTAEQRATEQGEWMIRSTDGGITWSERCPSLVNSPHGPIQLSDGRLLYAGKALFTGNGKVGVCESKDDGQSWQWLAEIPLRDGDTKEHYHELHMVEAGDGRLVAHIRNHNTPNQLETLQSESSDGGRSWTQPHSIGVWGVPSHLLRLTDGRLLMTYGYRREPYGNQARVSADHGKTWSDPVTIYGDGDGGDLGYPSTVQVEDGSLLTVWYERMKDGPNAVLRQARWSLGE